MTKARKEQYKSLAVIWIGFSLIGWRFHLWWLIAAAAVTLLAGLVSPYILAGVTDGWRWIGEKIGAITSRVILSFVFFIFLSPIAFLYRIFAARQNKGSKDSFFVERNHTYTAGDLEKLF